MERFWWLLGIVRLLFENKERKKEKRKRRIYSTACSMFLSECEAIKEKIKEKEKEGERNSLKVIIVKIVKMALIFMSVIRP